MKTVDQPPRALRFKLEGAIRGRRLRTGDLGCFDEDGFPTVTGRTRDVIIQGGVNISPLEIDNALVSVRRGKALSSGGCESHPTTVVPVSQGGLRSVG